MVQAEYVEDGSSEYRLGKHAPLSCRIYRYENYLKDVDIFMRRICVDKNVPRDHRTNYLGEYDWREWADTKVLKWIKDHCARDFEVFGYDPDQCT